MHLFFTDDTFVANGLPRPDVPFLCGQDMELVPAPNEFLRYIAIIRGRTRAPKTWKTYAEHLYEFFSFLEANSWPWASAEIGHIVAWRDEMLERGCSRNTVNQRMRCVSAFYTWAARTNRSHTLRFTTHDVWVDKPRGFLAHIDATGGRVEANELTLRTHTRVQKFLHMDRTIQFLEATSPITLTLMGYLALLTGMRREEIIGLDYRVVPNPAGHDPKKQLRMLLDPTMTPTKGSTERFVMLPFDLAVALWDYFCREWPKRHALYARKNDGASTTRFFLSALGDHFSIKHLNNAFAKVSAHTGIQCHPHMLRHTFGTYELMRMSKKHGESKALLWVRDRMGHSSITTTERYIHAADLVANDEVDGYQADLCLALRRGH